MSNTVLLGCSAVALALAMALTPALFAAGPALETRFFPVIRHTEVSHVEQSRGGVSFFVSFHKARQCQFVGVVWYQGAKRLAVNFEPHAEDAPSTRPVGAQYTGPWRIDGLGSLQGSRAYAYHRCHPLWTTITTFYKG